MNHTSKDLERLIELMAKLPGLGPRSARRAVLHMVKKRALIVAPLADVLAEVAKTVRECLNCGNIGMSDSCDICKNPARANGEICVVQDVSDLWAMERSNIFKGRYHVLDRPVACPFRVPWWLTRQGGFEDHSSDPTMPRKLSSSGTPRHKAHLSRLQHSVRAPSRPEVLPELHQGRI